MVTRKSRGKAGEALSNWQARLRGCCSGALPRWPSSRLARKGVEFEAGGERGDFGVDGAVADGNLENRAIAVVEGDREGWGGTIQDEIVDGRVFACQREFGDRVADAGRDD